MVNLIMPHYWFWPCYADDVPAIDTGSTDRSLQTVVYVGKRNILQQTWY